MQVLVTLDLPTDARAAAVMLADPAYVLEKVLASGALDQQVDVAGDAVAGFTVTIRRGLPTDAIPAHLRSFVGSRIDVRQVEVWEPADAQGSRTGTVVLEIAGAPVRLTGRVSLTALEASTSRLVYEGEIKAAVPLFGAVVEEAASEAVRAALLVEESVAQRWIETHPAV
ncbi:DUF2505 domain-containing protein [Cellulomonas soli]|uniref:DUF2505 domain-containing protein n=1 Tax=Cellulomonas soli TaxID=931535 RepID=A0A512P853_9CELL|nr:DUF2505 domain-containing protein [Cellulomonas soli]NYI57604.1 hypothetical protein [Cellulomonas soli]GEP67381.1 hypothetical protein CSO01_00960 [Cellulomonas soli]